MTAVRTRAEQKEQTRLRLVAVARRLFTEHGYDATGVGMVCRRARVTHGALYHHFPGKLELFVAVLEDVTRELVVAIADATAQVSGWARLERACDVYLDKCSDPAVIAIVLRDGPRVVPHADYAQVDHAANEPLVTGLLQTAIDDGVLRAVPVPLVARVLGAAFAAAGTAIAESQDRKQTQRDARALLVRWLESLRP